MSIQLKQVGSNMTEIRIDGVGEILFSYSTPVAARVDRPTGASHWIKTRRFYSVTTSRHINKWLDGIEAAEVEQSVLDSLLSR